MIGPSVVMSHSFLGLYQVSGLFKMKSKAPLLDLQRLVPE
jgi:hypothetical protein